MRRAIALALALVVALPLAGSAVASATDELKPAGKELVDRAGAALRNAVLTANPLNNNHENAGYYLTNNLTNFWQEARLFSYFVGNKRPNLNLATTRFGRLKLIAARVDKILEPSATVELEGLPTPHPSYPFVKKAWARVKEQMTKIDGMLTGGGGNGTPPADPPAPPPSEPPPADPPSPPTDPSPAPPAPPPASPAPAPADAPADPPVPPASGAGR